MSDYIKITETESTIHVRIFEIFNKDRNTRCDERNCRKKSTHLLEIEDGSIIGLIERELCVQHAEEYLEMIK